MQIFEEVLFFKLRTTTKTEKQTIQFSLCQLHVGGWQKEKGTRLTGVIKKRPPLGSFWIEDAFV